MNDTDLCRTVAALRQTVAAWRREGASVGLVPTMGALHAGHQALIRAARARCDRVIVSIFVNPKQFGVNEDFAAYPRQEAADRAKAAEAGAVLIFAPTAEEMYPACFTTTVTVDRLTEGLCGPHRPGHFAGVATIVSKLLLQALPDAAFFGEKDYQQLLVVTRMARDLDIPVRIVGVPTVREADGLALSSRNIYLSAEHRKTAPVLAATLRAMAERLAQDGGRVGEAIDWGIARLAEAGFARLDYLAVCDAETLAPLERVDRPARILVAAHLGTTRLIDNVAIPR
ncbi:MAG: pantoate--beta-alanine ligase [Alphaproteobacteria bacterium]|nr:pantoate--beta-alanine ligase [Alphaproteobacteria bacterium]